MQLISRSFLLLFLPISLLIYWKLLKTQKTRIAFLFLLSLGFYALADIRFIPLIISLSLLTYWLARKNQSVLGILLNLGALILFKYWDFGIDKFNTLAIKLDLPVLLPLFNLALPLGLSYYIFKHIGYLLDVRKQRYPASESPLTFLTYSIFFPQISAGPISSYGDTGKQLATLPARLSPIQSYQGLLYLTFGLAKKLLIADALTQLIQQGIYTPGGREAGFFPAWAFIILSGLQLYFDFSGYTDIALGVGHIFGLSLPENFNSPYLAKSPSDFWERWHISLSLWFRVYIFSPLSRFLLIRLCSKRKLSAQVIANVVTMTLVGIWHGTGWGFILWGTYHGILISIYAALSRKNYAWLNTAITQITVLIGIFAGWALFFTTGISNIALTFKDMLGLNGLGQIKIIDPTLITIVTIILPLALVITFSGNSEARHFKNRYTPKLAAALGLLLAFMLLLSDQVSDFTYAQF